MMARPRKNAAASRASLLPESAPLPEIPVREQPYPLPEGWKWVRLGSVVVVSKEKKENFSSELRYIGLEHIEKDKGIIGYTSAEGIRSVKNVFHPGQVLYGRLRPYLNKHDIADFSGVCSTDILVLDCKKSVNSKFINLFFNINYAIEYAVANSKGINLPRVSEKVISNIPFPLPPREEQERIVGHIESLFARLDEARQKAEAVRDSVALRRAAILHKAFTGELTAKWREEQGISKESWEEKDFAHIITNIEAGKNIRCEERPPHENEVGIIKVSAVTWGFFNEMESKTCPDASLYNENIQIKRGDFLFSRANTIQLVGNCVIVENITKKLMLSDKILRFSIDRCTLKNYLLFFSMSEQYRRQIENAASGNQDGMRNISQKKLLGLTIPLPTLPEQREIVRILDDLLGREQRIREAADAVVAHIERMKKAILAHAFRGELGRADCPSRP